MKVVIARVVSIASLVGGLSVGACTDDNGKNTTDVVEPGTSPLTGVNVNVTVTEPTPNADCKDAPMNSTGAKYPWGGLKVGDKTYTCNACPNGSGDMQGKFRFHGYDDANDKVDYSYPDPAHYKEVLYIDGNTFYFEVEDNDQHQSYYTRGWYFCSEPPENGSKHLFWQAIGSDDPAQKTALTETDAILSDGPNNTLLRFFDSPGSASSVVRLYCKIGTTRDGQTCTDPFEP